MPAFEPLLDWLVGQSDDHASPLFGLVDMDQLAVAGHSRGGKLGALLFAGALWLLRLQQLSSDMYAGALAHSHLPGDSLAPAGQHGQQAGLALLTGMLLQHEKDHRRGMLSLVHAHLNAALSLLVPCHVQKTPPSKLPTWLTQWITLNSAQSHRTTPPLPRPWRPLADHLGSQGRGWWAAATPWAPTGGCALR